MRHFFQIFLLACILTSFSPLKAQIQSVDIGVNGLTCSLCIRSVEMAVRELTFVKDVKMNLKETRGKILFHEDSLIHITQLAQKVKDAGFSVRYIKAKANFVNASILEDGSLSYRDIRYKFLDGVPKKLEEDISILFLGEKFQGRKQYKKWQDRLPTTGKKEKGNLYFVTI